MVTFVETRLFTNLVSQYLPDDEYAGLQGAIAAHPEYGSVIRYSEACARCGGVWRGEASAEAFG